MNFKSQRVETFALQCFFNLCEKFKIDEIKSADILPVLNSYSLINIFDKIYSYSSLVHQGKYGHLIKEIQDKLNVKLAILDLKGASFTHQRDLIKSLISLNDDFIHNQAINKISSINITQIINDKKITDKDFLSFSQKFDILLIENRNILYKLVNDDNLFNIHYSEMINIFQKYLQKATDIYENNS